MLVKKFDSQSFIRQGDSERQNVYPWPGTVSPPFGAVWTRLRPGQSTRSNGEARCESLFIARGRARVASGGREAEIRAGDVAFPRPADGHRLSNVSDSDDLLVMSLHWPRQDLGIDDLWIQRLDPSTFLRAYNADLQVVYPCDGIEPPFGAVWSVIRPGETSKAHAHQECETFIIVKGRGRMLLAGEEVELEAGDVTFHRPFDEHELTNVSPDEDLMLIDVYWEQKEMWTAPTGALAGEAGPLDAPPTLIEEARRVLVTSAAPTPNGDLHVGHLSGPYLAPDVIVRYLRLRGTEAFYAAGTDDNSFFVKGLADELGQSPQDTADGFHRAINETLEMFGVERALTPQPTSEEHIRIIQDCFLRLYEEGKIEEREAPLPYCEPCDLFLYEPYIAGRCAYCGEGMVGHTCEECGWHNDPMTLVEPHCTRCGRAAGQRSLRRFFFPLRPYTRQLLVHHRETPSSPRFRAFCEHVLERGAPDICIAYPSDWGIPVPLDGFEDLRLWSWFELGPRYFNYSRLMADKLGLDSGWETYWKADDEPIVRLIGFDNSFYDGLLLNAVYLAYDENIHLPAAYVVNELYRLDGAKFSTSRNHRILGRDLLAEAPRDALRYFLAYDGPEREQTDFTLERFRDTVRRHLHRATRDWLADLGQRLSSDYQGTVPATGDWLVHQRRFFHRLGELLESAAAGYRPETCSLQRATGAMRNLVREARRFGRGERYWKLVESRSQEHRTGMALELLAAKVLAVMAAPIMPDFAGRLWQALGLGADGPGDGSWNQALDWVPDGQRLAGLGQDFFPGLADYLEKAG